MKISTQVEMLYPLLKAAEQLRQLHGQVHLVIESEGIPTSLQKEIEKLLQAYGVSYEFE